MFFILSGIASIRGLISLKILDLLKNHYIYGNFTHDGGCEIEVCKPASCKDYPYTDKPERLFSLLSILESASICPVVFEILERLKKEYRFKGRKKY